jgi:hypothetical protein
VSPEPARTAPPEQPTWIFFTPAGHSRSGRTLIWHVETKTGHFLGDISWHAPWRCYAFEPMPGTVWERKCLRDIADFCERETMARRRNV